MLFWIRSGILGSLLLLLPSVHAEDGGFGSAPMHWSGDRTRIYRQNDQVELWGNAAVHQMGESLTADHIFLDMNTRVLHADGHCIYYTADTLMYGEEMYFNIDTHTGTVINGRVTNSRFSLAGERINKLGPRRFQTHRGEYTTCQDCPNSWSLRATDVDMEFEGYAYMSNVSANIKDSPIFWTPYLIMPLKTKRQSGFLTPKFSIEKDVGIHITDWFFWAINRWSDMTFGFGNYFGRGPRGEVEGRYKLSSRSGGQGNFYYLRDGRFPFTENRYGLNIRQFQELPWHIDEKLRIQSTSDNLYPNSFGGMPKSEAYLSSDFILSGATDQLSMFFAVRRFRSLVNIDSPTAFDNRTVQVYPNAGVTTSDRSLIRDPDIVGGVNLGFTNFARAGASYDVNPNTSDRGDCGALTFCPGIDALREGMRASVTPNVYTGLRLWDRLVFVPSMEYRAFFYDFKQSNVPNLARGYGSLRADFSTDFQRVYETNDVNSPRVKHLIRPEISYSRIPIVNESRRNHPFLQQIEYGQEKGLPGWYFDSYDIVPLDSTKDYASYFPPLGNSLTLGFTTQLIRRDGPLGSLDPTYAQFAEWKAGQTINFRELNKKDGEPLSRFTSSLAVSISPWSFGGDYFYQPYTKTHPDNPATPQNDAVRRHGGSARVNYVFASASPTNLSTMSFDRSMGVDYHYEKLSASGGTHTVGLSGTFSINDFFKPSGAITYNLLTSEIKDAAVNLSFQSPSRCWGLQLGMKGEKKNVDGTTDLVFNVETSFSLQLNLTGDGFGTPGSFASSVRDPKEQ